MRFGLFYEHQLPRPWEQGAEERVLSEALEQIEIADRIGIDVVWEVEHHFLEEYSHSSAPEVFLAAASQRTQRIRLGHGIVQLPPAFNHPARVAERIATLDLISGGRVEFGTGESSSQMELGGFGVLRDEKRAQWEEALDVVVRMMVEEPFAGHDGRYLSVPVRNVVPKPKQKPHPPLWVACSRRETILLAARKGIGALAFSFVEPEEARAWADEYERIITSDECVPAGFAVNPSFAVVLPLMCHPDEETAIARGIDGGHFFGYSLAHYYVFGEHRPARTNVWEEFEQHRDKHGFAREIIAPAGEPLGIRIFEQGLGSLRGGIGTPEQIADLVSRYEQAGVDQVIFVAQAGNNRHADVCESLELFGKEVLPRFAEHAPAREEAKRERLADATERALARRRPRREAPADYVVTAQGEPRPARTPLAAGKPAQERPHVLEHLRARAFTSLVQGRTDRQIERVFGSERATGVLFRGMARRFVPDAARGFTGTVQYELSSGGREIPWMISIDGQRARATMGRARDPAVTIRASLADFLRIIVGELNAGKAAMEQRIQIHGDFQVAARLGEMFGRAPAY